MDSSGIDQPTNDSITIGKNRIRFTSSKESAPFNIIGPLRRLDADLADSLIQNYSQLAEGVTHLPYGQEEAAGSLPTDIAAVEETSPHLPMEWDEVGLRWIPISQWLKTTLKFCLKRRWIFARRTPTLQIQIAHHENAGRRHRRFVA